MRNLAIWILYFIPALLVELMCYVLSPLVALFTIRELRTDRVKRAPWNNKTFTFDRDYIIKPLRWFQTHDNAVDEWWFGAFNADHHFAFARNATNDFYDNTAWFRWYCRVVWMWRNNAYGFLYNIFGRPVDALIDIHEHGVEDSGKLWWLLQVYQSSFQFEAQVPLYGVRHLSINIGWKSHKGFPRMLYANRIIGFRKYKREPMTAH